MPILRGNTKLALTTLLGTGFFVGSGASRHLITAKHVFSSNPVADDEHYAFAMRVDGKLAVHRITKVLAANDCDVAACPVQDIESSEFLRFSHDQPGMNEDVFSFEYSSTRFERKSSGGLHVTFEPLSHKGNVMRFYTSTFPEPRPVPSLQVSYPALQGASGAPVIASNKAKQFYVTGILVANIERELLPAQIVRIDEPGKYTEETKYFLPHGKAIDSKVVVPFLQEIGVEHLYIEDAPPPRDARHGVASTAASRKEGQSVIARIINRVLAMIAQFAGSEPGR